jgi:glycosyltransferase involved in cell wall biosynthesis
MAIFNGQIFLTETIESILNQTSKDYKIILVDDGSSEQSREIISSYAEKESRIKVIFNPVFNGRESNYHFRFKALQTKIT